jgi:hypothetical protein
MIRKHLYLVVFACFLSGCTDNKIPQAPPAGDIPADSGGVVGYQHGFKRSGFIVGVNGREVSEFGFIKVVGSEGTFAVDANNGAVIAIPNAHSTEQQKSVWYTLGADKHNQQVLDYFATAGIPKDQIGGVHATTSLYATGGADGAAAPAPQPKIAGWQSVLERVIDGVPVVDSLAWARMSDQGKVISEWVYWPAIPSKAMNEARQLSAKVSQEGERTAFLSRLPHDLPPGKVVIRHSAASDQGPFEVFASYDVVERRMLSASIDPSSADGMIPAVSIVRHFDIEGNERKFAQESRRPGGDLLAEKRPPSAGATQ